MKIVKLLMMGAMIFLSVSVFAQDSTKVKANGQQAGKTKYSCSMHPDVVSTKPGKCPKCGMALTKVADDHKKTYTCSMHPDVTSDKPGKCPKCKMALIEKKGDNKL